MNYRKLTLGIGLVLALLALVIFYKQPSILPETSKIERDSATDKVRRSSSMNQNGHEAENSHETSSSALESTSLKRGQPKNTIPFSQSNNKLRNDPSKWFEGATLLAESGHSEVEYIESLLSLLEDYKVITKQGGYPTGLNVEITNALLGKNSKKIAIIPEDHPRINDLGELVDSWNTPYHFHNESLQEIEVRSAGPDKEFYTEDDIEL